MPAERRLAQYAAGCSGCLGNRYNRECISVCLTGREVAVNKSNANKASQIGMTVVLPHRLRTKLSLAAVQGPHAADGGIVRFQRLNRRNHHQGLAGRSRWPGRFGGLLREVRQSHRQKMM